jgi:hypothetical protein
MIKRSKQGKATALQFDHRSSILTTPSGGRLAARAPDAGEDFVDLSGKVPTMPMRPGVQKRDGFTNLSEEAFLK